MVRNAVLHLLAGLPGSGKTTHAFELERNGATRVSVDERMLAAHGQIGIDYPVEAHLDRLGPVVADALADVAQMLDAGLSVVFDHGLGTRVERDEARSVAIEHGATWQLWSFEADIDVLLHRLARRGGGRDDSPRSRESAKTLGANRLAKRHEMSVCWLNAIDGGGVFGPAPHIIDARSASWIRLGSHRGDC